MTNRKNRSWSKEIIIQEIQRLHRENVPLYSHHLRKTYQELLAAGMRHFGGWKEAVKEAGFAYEDVRRYRKWDNQSIVETIQKLYQEGVDLSFRSMMLSTYAPMVYAAIRSQHFGSWRDALAAAGLPAEDIYRYRSWDDQVILDEIKMLNAKGVDLSSKKMDESSNTLIATARRRFGTWEKAIEEAGLDYSSIRRRQRWTREVILEKVKVLLAENPEIRGIDVKLKDPALFAAICKPRFFGNWSKVMESIQSAPEVSEETPVASESRQESIQEVPLAS
ncbi:MAG: hypothetical protein V4507_09875 [Verrucomicrobiota bacterium]